MSGIDPSTSAPEAQPAPKQNPFGRIFGVLFSPGQTFRSIAERPDWLVPLLVIFVCSLVNVLVVMQHIDMTSTIREQLEAQHVPPDKIEQRLKAVAMIGKVSFAIAPVLSIVALVIVAAIFLGAFRAFGGNGRFSHAFSITLYSWMPFVILGLVTMVVVLMKGQVSVLEMQSLVHSNPAFLASQLKQPVLYALLASLDVFTIWVVVLMSIGFAKMSGFSTAKSAVTVVSVFLIWIFIKIGFAALGAMMRSRA